MTVHEPTSHDGEVTAGPTIRQATVALQVVLAILVGYNLYGGQPGLAFNAALMLGLALTPAVLRSRTGRRLHPVLAFLIAASGLLHAVGAMGPYADVPLYDQIAHATSSSLVAGLGYVVAMVIDREYDAVEIPPALRFVFILIFAISFGVLWEIVEFATDFVTAALLGETILTQYGLEDTVLDMVFNTVGALLVAIWGTQYFDAVRTPVARQLDDMR